MMNSFKVILELQEKDLNMLRLMELKNKRRAELDEAMGLRKDLQEQLVRKENEVLELKKDVKISEGEIRDIEEKLKHLEAQQGSVKKVEEFNALNKEVTDLGRKKSALEHRIEELSEKLAGEQELQDNIRESLDSTTDSAEALEKEILDSIALINNEGRTLQEERSKLAAKADSDVLWIYERLLSNKRDRVIVPIEGRTCSGCHIVLTAQHENLVRKGEKLVFCEHCSRIHYWQDTVALEAPAGAPKRRRRSKAA